MSVLMLRDYGGDEKSHRSHKIIAATHLNAVFGEAKPSATTAIKATRQANTFRTTILLVYCEGRNLRTSSLW